MMHDSELDALLGRDFMDGRKPSERPDGVTRVPESKCLGCGTKLDAAGTMDHEPIAPRPGDPVICLHCGGVMIYGADMRPRAFTEKEADRLLDDKAAMAEIALTCQGIYHVLKQRHRRN